MATEIKKVLEVDTGKSTKSIKELRDEIKKLKTEYESAEIGSEKFERASNDLAIAQADLKTALVDGKKATDNAEGSYNHLAATMAELKKQWRATANEVKRNELGKQIDSINDRLKGMDSSIGNNQRLVGSYAEEFKKALNEQQDATIVTKTKLESLQKITAGLASGYAALQGVTALLGIENENLEKTFVKVQSAMAIAQGVGGLKDLVEGLDSAKVAFGDTTKGTKAFITGMSGVRKAVIATGIGALVVAVGALIANWEKLNDLFSNTSAIDRARKATREYNAEIKKLANESSTKNILRVKELSLAYTSLGDNLNDKRKFVTEYKDELKQMGIQMNNVNDADKVFITQTEDYIKALTLRAKADGTREYASKKYNEELDKISEKEKALAETFDVIIQSPNNIWGDGLIMEQLDYYDASTISREYGVLPAIASNFKNLRSEIPKLKKEASVAIEDLIKDAIALENEAAKILNGGATETGTTETNTTLDNRKKLQEELYQYFLDEQQREIRQVEISAKEKAKIAGNNATLIAEIERWKQAEIDRINLEYSTKEKERKEKELEDYKKLQESIVDFNLNDMLGMYHSDDLIQTYQLQLDALEVFHNEELISDQEYWDKKRELEENYVSESNRIQEEYLKSQTEYEKARKNQINATINGIGSIIGSMSEIVGKETKAGKALAVSQALISTYLSAQQAYQSAFLPIPTVASPVLGAVSMAAAIASGLVNVRNILKVNEKGETSVGNATSSSSPAAVPNITTSVPMTQVRNIQTDAEIAEMNKAQKVYVLESDITTAQKRVEVRENNASF